MRVFGVLWVGFRRVGWDCFVLCIIVDRGLVCPGTFVWLGWCVVCLPGLLLSWVDLVFAGILLVSGFVFWCDLLVFGCAFRGFEYFGFSLVV